MSFFGNTTYYLNNTFDKFTFKNDGETIYTDASEEIKNVTFFPTTETDELIIETGNRWLRLEGTASNTLKVFHTYPAADDENQTSIDLLQPWSPQTLSDEENANGADSEEQPDFVQLGWDDLLTGANIKYDAAGHIAMLEPTYFKLPKSASEQDFSTLTAQMAAIRTLDSEDNSLLVTTITNLRNAVFRQPYNRNRIESIENLSLTTETDFAAFVANVLNFSLPVPESSVAAPENSLLKTIRDLQADLATKNLAIQALEARIIALENKT